MAESTLRSPDAVHRVQDLALEVRGVDHVHVDDADGAHPGRGQVQRGGRAEAARAEEQHPGVEQLELALLPHLGDEQVALVAVALLGGQGPGRLPGTALVLPAVEPAHERHHVACSRGRSGSWPRRRSAPRPRSTRRPEPTCRGSCPRPGTRAAHGEGARPRGSHPARTRRARARRAAPRRPRRGSTSSARTSRMADLAWVNNSLAVATTSRPSGSRPRAVRGSALSGYRVNPTSRVNIPRVSGLLGTWRRRDVSGERMTRR